MSKTKTNPAAGLAAMRDPELTVERNRLNGRLRTLDRQLCAAVTAGSVAEHVERAQERGRAELRRVTTQALPAASSATVGSRSWQDVEGLVTAAVLASPAFAEVIERTLAEHLPTEADFAPLREERDQAQARVAAIDEELAERRERAHREYLEACGVPVEVA